MPGLIPHLGCALGGGRGARSEGVAGPTSVSPRNRALHPLSSPIQSRGAESAESRPILRGQNPEAEHSRVPVTCVLPGLGAGPPGRLIIRSVSEPHFLASTMYSPIKSSTKAANGKKKDWLEF